MADRTPLKFADRNAISDDDPFAELTRIMGFDPRQPVKPQAADPVMTDDFDIDLEKELMGEFGLDAEEGISAAENAPAPEVVGPPAHHDMAGHDMDKAVAASMQDFELDTSDLHADGEAPHHAAPEVEFERDFDDDLAQALDTDAEPHLQWPMEEEAAAVVAEDAAEPVEAAVAAHDFDAHFDEAMADVDMDFEASAVSAYEPDVPQAVETVADDSAGRDEELTAEFEAQAPHQASAADPFEEAFSSLGHEDVPVEAVAVEPAAPVAAKEERSLEDELNALLGNMGARISKPASAASPFSWASNAGTNPSPAADPFAVAAVGYGAQQQAPQPEQHDAVEAETHADIDAGIDAMLLEELASSDIADEAKAETPADHAGTDFDTADFEAFVRDDAAERAAVAPAPEMPILARSWNRMMSTPTAIQDQPKAAVVHEAEPAEAEAAEPASFEEPQPAAVEEHYSLASAYQPVSEPASAYPYEPEAAAEEPDEAAPATAYDEIPDVETIDVPERVEALADDLDLPELAFEEDRPAKTGFDDLDAEFAGLLSELNDPEEAPVPPPAPSYDDEPYEAGFRHVAAQGQGDAPAAYAAQHPAQAAVVASHDDGFDAASAPDMRPFAPVETFAADELDYDPEFDEAMAVPGVAENAVQPRRRGLLIAAVVAGVAVIGGIGAFALSPGGGGDGAPVLVKADNAPIKVKPENPGGTVVPNQDNKVYEAVAKGIQPAAPEQQKLVANTQEPVNVNTAAPQNRVVDLSPDGTDDVATTGTATSGAGDAAPTAKSEDRIEPGTDQTAAASTNQDVALV
ncbi:MAG: SPOR domain-containing protein, partial [Mesorhizobium sp.]